MHNRIWICGGIAVVGLVFGMVASTQAMQMEFVEVADLQEKPANYEGRRIKVAGTVAAKTTTISLDQAGRTELRFIVQGEKGGQVWVYHRGPKPDAFQDGGMVILEGYYDPRARGGAGELNADSLLAKCPSRYEEAGPGAGKGYGKPGEADGKSYGKSGYGKSGDGKPGYGKARYGEAGAGAPAPEPAKPEPAKPEPAQPEPAQPAQPAPANHRP